jgi:hypothetical protein
MSQHITDPAQSRSLPERQTHPPRLLAGKGLRTVLALACVGLLASSAALAQCDHGGLYDAVHDDSTSIYFQINYTDDDSSASDYLSTANAQLCAQTAAAAYELFKSYFRDPYQNGLESGFFHICVYDMPTAGIAGTANADRIVIDAPSISTSATAIANYISHELFHTVQRRYMCSTSVDCSSSASISDTFGSWVSEGQAAVMQDQTLAAIDGSGQFRARAQQALADPAKGIWDWAYPACLFWKYCCEQYGFVELEPERGVDFLGNFWSHVDATGTNASVDHLEYALNLGGGTIDDTWQSFAICNFAKDFDVSALPDEFRYHYIDENQYGEGTYGSVPVTPWSGITLSGGYDAFTAQYYSMDFAPGSCAAVGVHGTANYDVGWALLGLETGSGGGTAKGLSRQQGREYYRAFLASPTTNIDRIAAVVATYWDFTSQEIKFGSGPVTVAVQTPTTDQPAYVGLPDDPGRLVMRVMVAGPAELTPSSPDTLAMAGLAAEDFAVTIGGLLAEVYSAGYVGGYYSLVVQAPAQSADGRYDLTVGLCGSAAVQTVTEAVDYSNTIVNHVLVLDVSGSMGSPSTGTSKLEAAQMAASMYVDALPDLHRLGVVTFSGDGSEAIADLFPTCNDDADILAGLDFSNGFRRALIKLGIAALTPDQATSLGDGLWTAQDLIESVPAGDINMITVLSDGNETEGRFWSNLTLCPPDWGQPANTRIIPTSTIVNTLAFGADSDQSLMSEISEQTGGVMDYIPVESTLRDTGLSMVNTLALAYIDALANTQDVERVVQIVGDATPSYVEVGIPVTESTFANTSFIFNVDDPSAALVVELRDPSGHVIGSADAQIYTNDTHAVFHLHSSPAVGLWTARLTVAAPSQYIAVVLAADRHSTQVEFGFYQVRTGGLDGVTEEGFEPGVPVHFVGMPTDGSGLILGATFHTTIELPDGTLACGDFDLRDDGKSGDGEANDGVYGAIFTQTSQGSREGVDNDSINPPPPPPPPWAGQKGTYTITVVGTGQNNRGDTFQRIIRTGFHIHASFDDADGDGIPDSWELTYGTGVSVADSNADPDEDGLTNADEFELGTNPFDPDTDGDGENDGSEAAAGRCPMNAADKQLSFPADVNVVKNNPNDSDEAAIIPPESLVLRFPWYSEYAVLRIYRAADTPSAFALIRTLASGTGAAGTCTDSGLQAGRTYFYRFQSETTGGAVSRYSRIVSGVPAPGVVATQWICGADVWSSTDCWSALWADDAYPANAVATYDVSMQPGAYTCSLGEDVDPHDVLIRSLRMTDAATRVEVWDQRRLDILNALSGPGTVAAMEAGSLVRLPELTTLAGPTDSSSGVLQLEAANNGRIELPNLTGGSGNVTFHAHHGAAHVSTVSCPQLSHLWLGASIRVRVGGRFVGAPLVDLSGASLVEVHTPASELDLSHVVGLDDAEVFADGAAVVSLPLVTSVRTGVLGPVGRSLRAKNLSDLSFPALASIDSGPNSSLLLWTYFQGKLHLPALTGASGSVNLWIDGDGALIELKNAEFASPNVIRVGDAPQAHAPGGELRVHGSMSYVTTDPANFVWRGDATHPAILNMLGGAPGACVTLEVASRDCGPNPPTGCTPGFQLDRLRIGPGAVVRLVDNIDNGHRGGSIGTAEALYVNTLEFADANGRLILNDKHLYRTTLIGSSTQIIAATHCPGDCPGDGNGDGQVDLSDLASVLSSFGLCTPSAGYNAMYDSNGDGCIDLEDLAGLLSEFGTDCP